MNFMHIERFGVLSPIGLEAERVAALEQVMGRVGLKPPRSIEEQGFYKTNIMEMGEVPRLDPTGNHAYCLGVLTARLAEVWADYVSPRMELGRLVQMGKNNLAVELHGEDMPEELRAAVFEYLFDAGEVPQERERDYKPHVSIGRGYRAARLARDPGLRREVIDLITPSVVLEPPVVYLHPKGEALVMQSAAVALEYIGSAEYDTAMLNLTNGPELPFEDYNDHPEFAGILPFWAA